MSKDSIRKQIDKAKKEANDLLLSKSVTAHPYGSFLSPNFILMASKEEYPL